MAGDALGRVYNKQEGSGAAQLFGRSEVVDDLRKTGLQLYAQEDAARQKQAAMIKPKEQKLPEMGQGWYVDQSYITDGVKQFTLGATQKVAAGVELTADPEYQNSAYTLKTAIEGSTQQQKMYDVQRNAVVADPKKYDVDASMAALEDWKNIPLMQRLATPMPDPVYRKEEITFDLFKETGTIALPYTTTRKYNEDRSGKETEALNQKSLFEQSKYWVKSRNDVYEWGLKPQESNGGKPLWTNQEEAAEYVYQFKKSQAKYSVKEILNAQPDNNAFGSGQSKEDVILAKEDWKRQFVGGNEEAAAYITGKAGNGVKTNDGYALDGVRTQTFNLEDPAELGRVFSALGIAYPAGVSFQELKRTAPAEYQKLVNGVKSQYKNDYGGNTLTIYKYKGVGTPMEETVDGQKNKKDNFTDIIIIANTLTDEELDDFFITKVEKSGRVYGYDYGVTGSGNIKVTDKKEPEDNTTKPSGTKSTNGVGSTAPRDRTFTNADVDAALKDPKNIGYTRQEIIDYYTSQGYKLK